MNIIQSHHEQVTVVAIDGRVDSLSADQLTEAFDAQFQDGRFHLVADFNAVSFTSSAGLRAVLLAVKECRRKGGDLRIAGLQPGVERVFSISGFSSIIKIYPEVPQAVASFNA